MNRPYAAALAAALALSLPIGAHADPAPASPTVSLSPLPDAPPPQPAAPTVPLPPLPDAPPPQPAPPKPAQPAAPPTTLPSSAPTTNTSKSVEEGEIVRAPGAPARTAIPEKVTTSPSRQYFFLHDDNYFALRANGSWPPRVKFQVSMRFEMLSFGNHPNVAVNFAYTQTSFWDLFAFDRSSPFVENDYRPELFVSIRPWQSIRYREIQLGVQHQSNGLGDDGVVNQTDNSRSWNYFFVDARWGFTRENPREAWFFVTPGVRAWIPFGVYAADNGNYDLLKYEGYVAGILDVDLRIPDHPNFGRLSARFMVREHNQQADLFYPIYGKVRCWLFGQYFHGVAERLITVADHVNSIYVGLGFQ
jgi:outer membrane phospholipase A